MLISDLVRVPHDVVNSLAPEIVEYARVREKLHPIFLASHTIRLVQHVVKRICVVHGGTVLKEDGDNVNMPFRSCVVKCC